MTCRWLPETRTAKLRKREGPPVKKRHDGSLGPMREWPSTTDCLALVPVASPANMVCRRRCGAGCYTNNHRPKTHELPQFRTSTALVPNHVPTYARSTATALSAAPRAAVAAVMDASSVVVLSYTGYLQEPACDHVACDSGAF